jgi:excisionase family DNA binding protein
MSTQPPLICRINAVTEKLGISRSTIYRLVKSGDLELVKVGARASGVTIKSLNAFLEKGKTAE